MVEIYKSNEYYYKKYSNGKKHRISEKEYNKINKIMKGGRVSCVWCGMTFRKGSFRHKEGCWHLRNDFEKVPGNKESIRCKYCDARFKRPTWIGDETSNPELILKLKEHGKEKCGHTELNYVPHSVRPDDCSWCVAKMGDSCHPLCWRNQSDSFAGTLNANNVLCVQCKHCGKIIGDMNQAKANREKFLNEIIEHSYGITCLDKPKTNVKKNIKCMYTDFYKKSVNSDSQILTKNAYNYDIIDDTKECCGEEFNSIENYLLHVNNVHIPNTILLNINLGNIRTIENTIENTFKQIDLNELAERKQKYTNLQIENDTLNRGNSIAVGQEKETLRLKLQKDIYDSLKRRLFIINEFKYEYENIRNKLQDEDCKNFSIDELEENSILDFELIYLKNLDRENLKEKSKKKKSKKKKPKNYIDDEKLKYKVEEDKKAWIEGQKANEIMKKSGATNPEKKQADEEAKEAERLAEEALDRKTIENLLILNCIDKDKTVKPINKFYRYGSLQIYFNQIMKDIAPPGGWAKLTGVFVDSIQFNKGYFDQLVDAQIEYIHLPEDEYSKLNISDDQLDDALDLTGNDHLLKKFIEDYKSNTDYLVNIIKKHPYVKNKKPDYKYPDGTIDLEYVEDDFIMESWECMVCFEYFTGKFPFCERCDHKGCDLHGKVCRTCTDEVFGEKGKRECPYCRWSDCPDQ